MCKTETELGLAAAIAETACKNGQLWCPKQMRCPTCVADLDREIKRLEDEKLAICKSAYNANSALKIENHALQVENNQLKVLLTGFYGDFRGILTYCTDALKQESE